MAEIANMLAGAYRRSSSPPAGFAAAAEQVSAPWLVARSRASLAFKAV